MIAAPLSPRALHLHRWHDFVSETIIATGDFYERAILDELARRVRGGVIVDVGAHIGNHAYYLAQAIPAAEVHAFEPLSVNLALLRRNTERCLNVTVHGVALGAAAGRARMLLDRGNIGHARIVAGGPHEVDVATLDSFGFQDVSLLKVDVEGYEPQVLAGARDTIARCRPLIVIEDWTRSYAALLPGYRLAAEWETAHQTFLYEWAGA